MQTISDNLLYSATVFNTDSSSGGSGSSIAEYVYENKTETVAFPRKLSTESTDYMFTDETSYKASDLEFSCYEPNSSIEGMSQFFDGNLATSGNMIDGLFFKFNKPVLLKSIYVYNSGGYEIILKGTNNLEIATTSYSDLWETIYTGGAESYDIDLESKEYQYYCLRKTSGYKTIYELKFYAVVGNVRCTLKSANMTPSFKCYFDDYMQVITQDWHNGSEIIPSQILTFKPYEDGGCLINYNDDGQAVKLGMYLLQPSMETIVTEKKFVQPVLSANGTIGGDAFAVEADSIIDSGRPAWKAFDGNTVMNDASYDQWHSNYGQPHWIKFYNPNPLSVSKVTIFNGNDNVMPLDWEFQYSDDNSDWHTLTSGTNTVLTANGEWSFDVANSGNHKYYRFYTTSGSGSVSSCLGLTEIQITGKEIASVTYDKPIYVLSPDNSFEMTGYNSKVKVADLNIPNRIGA